MLVRLRSEGNALAEAKAQLEKLQQGAAQAQSVFSKLGESLKNAFNLSQAKEAASHLGELKEAATNLPNIVEKLGTGDLPGAIAQFRQLGGVLAGLAATPLGAIGIGVAGLGAYGYTQLKAAREMREASDAMVAATNEKNLPKLVALLRERSESGSLTPEQFEGFQSRIAPLSAAQQALSYNPDYGIFTQVNPFKDEKVQAEIKRLRDQGKAIMPEDTEAKLFKEAGDSGLLSRFLEKYRAGLQEAILQTSTAIIRDARNTTGASRESKNQADRESKAGAIAIALEGYNQESIEAQEALDKILRDRIKTNEEQKAAIEEFYQFRKAQIEKQTGKEEEAAELELRIAQDRKKDMGKLYDEDKTKRLEVDTAIDAAQAQISLIHQKRETQLAQAAAENQSKQLDQIERTHAKEMAALMLHNAEVHRAVRDSNQLQQDEERNAAIRRTQITTNFALTKEEQDKLRLKSIDDEAAGLQKIIVQRQKLADEAAEAYRKGRNKKGIRPDELNALEAAASFTADSLDQAKRRGNDLNIERTGITAGPDPAKWSDQWTLALTRMRAETQGLAQYVTGTLTGALDHAIGGASNALAGAVLQTRGWQLELQRLPITIGVEIVSAIIKMGLQWATTQLFMAAFGKAVQASAVASSAPFAAASAAIWATPAALATIATYGGAAAAAPVQVGIAEAATLAGSLAAFADGGVTPGHPTLAWVGEKGPEVVIPANVTARMSPQERADAISGRGYGQGGSGGMSIVVAPSPEQAQRISREHMDAMWIDSARRNIHRVTR